MSESGWDALRRFTEAARGLHESVQRLKAHQFDTSKVNRVEVIDQTGLAYAHWGDSAKVEVEFQDNGRTLKVFISDHEAQQ